MKKCDKTITVFNRRIEDGKSVYIPTVISGVSWFCRIQTQVEKGLSAANEFTVRIPADAYTHGKTYVDPITFINADSADGIFTLANGDIVVMADIPNAAMTPAELQANFSNCFKTVGVTDARNTTHSPHWRVVGA